MAQYKTGCSYAHGLTETHFCATPSDDDWCTPFNAWEIINNSALAGVIGEEGFDNANLAKDACIQDDFCTGVAFEGKVSKYFFAIKEENFSILEIFSKTF